LDDAIKRYKLYLRKLNDSHQVDSILYERALNRFVPSLSYAAKPQINLHSTVHIDRTDLSVKGVIIASKPPLNGSSNSVPLSIINHTSSSNSSNLSNSTSVLNGSKKIDLNSNHENVDYTFDTVLKLLDESYYMR
jgi:hypothetical protein